MTPKKLIINGFKSFKGRQEFIFPTEPGLYSLQGVNKVDAGLGSNGAGKSTVWDAWCWALYGKTVRGLRAGDLNSWGSKKGFSVSFEWEDSGKHFSIMRSWQPNKLIFSEGTKEPLDVTQQEVDNVFGLPHNAFLFSILMGQARPMFMDLSSSEQSNIFSNIFSLDSWLERSDKAQKAAKDLSSNLLMARSAIDKLETEISFIKKDLSSSKKESACWKLDVSGKVRALNDKIASLNALVLKIESDFKILDLDEREISDDIVFLSDSAKDLSVRLEKANSALSALSEKTRSLIQSIKEKQNDIHFFENAEAEKTVCSCCGQAISIVHSKIMINFSKKEVERMRGEVNSVSAIKKTHSKRINAFSLRLKKIDGDIALLRDDKNELNSDLGFKKGQLRTLKQARSGAVLERESLHSSNNPYKQRERDLASDLALCKQHLGTAKRAFGFISEKKAQTEFWIKGFKEVRLFIMSEFLSRFEIEVCNALTKLGLPDWSVSFSAEKETKSKTIKKGFHITVKSPDNDSAVPWESWSGGESQRLRLAGNMGLSNLILEQYGVMSSIEIWDEPSTHLGKEGVCDLLESLRDRAISSNKQIWIVEHNVLDFGNFAGSALVIKDSGGSVIQQ